MSIVASNALIEDVLYDEGRISPGKRLDSILTADEQYDFPATLDRDVIALTLHQVLNALGSNQISPRRASMLLCGLQMATANSEDRKPAPTVVDSDLARLSSEIGDLLAQVSARGPLQSE